VKSGNDRIANVSRLVVIGLLAAGASWDLSPSNALAIGHEQYGGPSAQPTATMLRLGSRGAAVRELQGSLARLTYLPKGGVDGVFGMQTWHAVVAFQGCSGLSRDGIVGPRTRGALSHARAPTPWSRTTGFEIHIPQQVLLLVRDGRVQRSIHVSTGASGRTPLGHFHVYRRELMSWSVPFHVWMPLAQYFSGGYAMHEFASVPAYPASHGCVRVPDVEARTVWQFGAIGTRVWTRQ
jgi:hypothetical protein